MRKRILSAGIGLMIVGVLAACGMRGAPNPKRSDGSENGSYARVGGTQIKMITENAEVIITLNDSRAAADLAAMLPLELMKAGACSDAS